MQIVVGNRVWAEIASAQGTNYIWNWNRIILKRI